MSLLDKYARQLGGEARGNRILCPGPGHSRADRSLSVTFTADGSFVVHSFAGDDFAECRDHVKAVLGLDDREPQPLPPAPVRLLDKAEQIRSAIRIWTESVPLPGTPAEVYLAGRGLYYYGEALRFHPACPFRQERHPAMVGLMTDIITGEPTGIHRTALLPDGSGKAAPGKMMMGRAQNAAVRLSADETVTHGLAIAEGIETALAAPFRPIWACLSAATMTAFPVLSGVEALTIFADHDAAGIRAANDAGKRWHHAGREVTVEWPAAPGTDMADLGRAA
ncbi:MAG: virulence-associated protein E [Pelagibacterium sp. SCN 63-23]|nr:MAG: virulence-associated protein E [Pelagibacterium sp. SCN 63-23]